MVTRCDVHVDTTGQLANAGQPGRWGAWWALDGGDNTAALLELVRVPPGVRILASSVLNAAFGGNWIGGGG